MSKVFHRRKCDLCKCKRKKNWLGSSSSEIKLSYYKAIILKLSYYHKAIPGVLHPIPDFLSSRKLQIEQDCISWCHITSNSWQESSWPLFDWPQSYTDTFLDSVPNTKESTAHILCVNCLLTTIISNWLQGTEILHNVFLNILLQFLTCKIWCAAH